MRPSYVKFKILDLLAKSTHPLSVLDIQKNIPSHKTSLYRQIDQLVSEQKINSVDFSDGILRYESTSLPHHHHQICLKCKQVTDINIPEKKWGLNSLASTHKFNVLFHHLEFFGICHHCT